MLSIALVAAAAGFSWAQGPPAFDAVSVRPHTSGGTGTSFQIFPGGQFRATNATVRQLVQSAFDFTVERFQIVGGPSRIDVDRFDVQTAPPAPA